MYVRTNLFVRREWEWANSWNSSASMLADTPMRLLRHFCSRLRECAYAKVQINFSSIKAAVSRYYLWLTVRLSLFVSRYREIAIPTAWHRKSYLGVFFFYILTHLFIYCFFVQCRLPVLMKVSINTLTSCKCWWAARCLSTSCSQDCHSV